jgi:hypothetical protein
MTMLVSALSINEGVKMNGFQAKLARQALKLTYAGAAKLTGVNALTLQRVEREAGGKFARYGAVRPETIKQVQDAYVAAGITFVDDGPEGPGVRLRPAKPKRRPR